MPRSVLAIFVLLAGIASVRAQVVDIDSAGLERLMAEDVAVVDIRRPDEWRRTGVIEGSHLMTFFDARGNYDIEAWMSKLESVAIGNRKVAIVCHSGGRSRSVSRFLDSAAGYRRIYDVRDGIAGWIAANRPTVPYP